MKRDEREEALVERVREHLDTSVGALDERTASRLRRARLEALDAEGKGRGWLLIPRWITASGFATAAVIVVAGSFWFADYRKGLSTPSPEDLEIVASKEHVQLYEDLEFYRWLASEENGRKEGKRE